MTLSSLNEYPYSVRIVEWTGEYIKSFERSPCNADEPEFCVSIIPTLASEHPNV